VSFERFTKRRLTYIPGDVKLWESPGKAGGLPVIIKIRVAAQHELTSLFFSLRALSVSPN
jgi:hypothetical protein